jgi:putative transposase
MPNHFHLFLRINDKINFEKGIKNFFISYAKAINKKHNRVGSLFQGRYKASEITSDDYYTTIINYIHQNPVVAGLVQNMKDFKYSSYPSYLLDKPTLLNKIEVLEWFGGLEFFIEHHKVMMEDKKLDEYFEM